MEKTSATSDNDFKCACEDEARQACLGEPRFGEHEGKVYCVLHFPGKVKTEAFNESIKRKLDSGVFDFRGVWFPEETSFKDFAFSRKANFAGATFGAKVSFSNAIFSRKADFSQATFLGRANFNDATFDRAADFNSSRYLGNADFINATFKGKADFSYSEFAAEANFETTFSDDVDFLYSFFRGEAYFRYAHLSAVVNLRSASFEDYLRFGGEEFYEETSLDLQYARIDKPERVAFHTLKLRPYWFVNVDARKFDFINVDWNLDNLCIEREIEALEAKEVASPYRLLAITFRNLALNAEENQRFEEASKFRYLSSELWRKNEPHDSLTSVAGWLYWGASGYGERALRACIVLLAIWLLFGALYMNVGFERGMTKETGATPSVQPQDQWGVRLPTMRALIYSLGTMTLQKPEPRPLTPVAQTLVFAETVLGSIQAALLFLALRRKFMRS